MKTVYRHIRIMSATGTGKRRRRSLWQDWGRGAACVFFWTAALNSIMRRMRRRRYRILKRTPATAMAGEISGYPHIFRWKVTGRRSMSTPSIPGTDARKSGRTGSRRSIIRWHAMLNTLRCRTRGGETGSLFLFRELKVGLHAG